MPEKLHNELAAQARAKGLKGDHFDAYVYGTMNKIAKASKAKHGESRLDQVLESTLSYERTTNERAGKVTIVSNTCQSYKGVNYFKDCDTHDYVSRAGGQKTKLHIMVATDKKGSPLESDEIVHHLNNNKDHNHSSNLEIMKHGDHSRMTNEK